MKKEINYIKVMDTDINCSIHPKETGVLYTSLDRDPIDGRRLADFIRFPCGIRIPQAI